MTTEWLHVMDDEGKTPLDRAFQSGHRAVADMMIQQERRDRTDAENPADTTPLHRAANLGLAAAVRSLIAFGTDPTVLDDETETALHKAVRSGHVEVVAVLLEHCNVNAASSLGMAPLHWAAATGNAQMVELLMGHGADPNLRNECMDGLTPLELAQHMEYQELTDLMGQGSGTMA